MGGKVLQLHVLEHTNPLLGKAQGKKARTTEAGEEGNQFTPSALRLQVRALLGRVPSLKPSGQVLPPLDFVFVS
ncbi:hypothetical protein SUGI_0880210 [Cryptomeria japonica]|nr:hypothetical protein SUGI_0880210 [Cryptomeria japonica]